MRFWRNVLLTLLSGLTFTAAASVVIVGNRIIYPAQNQTVNIQLINRDNFPNVVQVWLDSGDEHSTPKTGRAPFLLTPPMFRMAPHSGQNLRLQFIGAALPQDKEAVFYLNTLQIPPIYHGEETQNQLVVMHRNRIKLFWRPAVLKGSPESMDKTTQAKIEHSELHVINNSGYFLSILQLALPGTKKRVITHSVMIAPGDTLSLPLPGESINAKTLSLSWINDQGSVQHGTIPLLH